MHKVDKFLLKLSRKERERIMPIIALIVKNDLARLDCKKLKGNGREYRVRIGSIRILFIRNDEKNVITDIDYRNDNTY